MGYSCENSTYTSMTGFPCRTFMAAQVTLGIEPHTSCMTGSCSDNRAIRTATKPIALGCIYATCAYESIVANTPYSHFNGCIYTHIYIYIYIYIYI